MKTRQQIVARIQSLRLRVNLIAKKRALNISTAADLGELIRINNELTTLQWVLEG